jgi:hypothetical protein
MNEKKLKGVIAGLEKASKLHKKQAGILKGMMGKKKTTKKSKTGK